MLPQSSDSLYISRSGTLYRAAWDQITKRDSKLKGSDRLIFERNRVEMYITLDNFWNNGTTLLTNTDYFMVERGYLLYKSPLVFDFTRDNWIKIHAMPGVDPFDFKVYFFADKAGTITTDQGHSFSFPAHNPVRTTLIPIDPWRDVYISFPRSTLVAIRLPQEGDVKGYKFDIDPTWDLGSPFETLDMFFQSSGFTGSGVENWDISKFSTLTDMFYDCPHFNANLNNWNTSNIKNMHRVFYRATSFNGNVSAWDTSNAVQMGLMFNGANKFNKPLTNWNTSNVTNMYAMFDNNESFNQPLAHFDTAKVTNMGYMFSGVNGNTFNQDISGWDVSNVTFFEGMFKTTNAFTQNLTSWCVPQQAVRPVNWDDDGIYKNYRSIHPNWGTCGEIGPLPPFDPGKDVCKTSGPQEHVYAFGTPVDFYGHESLTAVLFERELQVATGYGVSFSKKSIPSEVTSGKTGPMVAIGVIHSKDANAKWLLVTKTGDQWDSGASMGGWSGHPNIFGAYAGVWDIEQVLMDGENAFALGTNSRGQGQNILVWSRGGNAMRWEQLTLVPWDRNTTENLNLFGSNGFYAFQVGSQFYHTESPYSPGPWVEASWPGQPAKITAYGHRGFMWRDGDNIKMYNPFTGGSTTEPIPWLPGGNSTFKGNHTFKGAFYSQRTYYVTGSEGVLMSACEGGSWSLHRSTTNSSDSRYEAKQVYKANQGKDYVWAKYRGGASIDTL